MYVSVEGVVFLNEFFGVLRGLMTSQICERLPLHDNEKFLFLSYGLEELVFLTTFFLPGYRHNGCQGFPQFLGFSGSCFENFDDGDAFFYRATWNFV